MILLGYILMGLGALMLLAGGIWSIVEAFKTGMLWGVLVLLLGGIGWVIWAVKAWDKAWPPLVVQLGGVVPLLLGLLVVGIEGLIAIASK